MSEIKASPRNKYVGALSDVLRSVRNTGDKVDIPILGGLGSLFLGKSPEEIDEWSYGNAPMQMTPQGVRLPQMKRGRGAQVADTVFAAADLPALRAATSAAGRPLARALEQSPLTKIAQELGAQRSPMSMVKPRPDPIAEWVARNMIAELESVPKVSGMESLQKLNLPAAYAGDQRSLKAVQRGISESETGLESPGRRKIMKQAAATALRSAIPDTVVEGLGGVGLRNLAEEAISTPKFTSLLDDMMGEYGYSKHIPTDLRDLQYMFNMPDEVYYALREANPHGFGGVGSGGNYVSEYELGALLDNVLPGFSDRVLSKIPLDEARKYMELYDLEKPIATVDWKHQVVNNIGPEWLEQ